jgi:predicted DNA-binding protein with PD1-like motif
MAPSPMIPFPIRLLPGQDLRAALEAVVRAQGCEAAFVIAGIGSLCDARVRRAGVAEADTVSGDTEILSLSGTVAPDSSHLHILLADAAGQVLGGHVAPGCRVRTTAEVLLALLPDWSFGRAPDPQTGYDELRIQGPEPRREPG